MLVKRGMTSILKPDDEFDIRDVEENTLPESLRENWQLLSMSVPVACLAVERSWINLKKKKEYSKVYFYSIPSSRSSDVSLVALKNKKV